MTRRFKKLKEFDVSLEIKNAEFIRPPREAQRNWLLNRALGEFAADLTAIHGVAGRFVPGSEGVPLENRVQADLEDREIMEDWQFPVMDAMAKVVCEGGGDVLEIGFGRGVSSEYIQREGVRSHTVIECNDRVVDRYQAWRARHADRDIRLAHGLWQDVIGGLGQFDGIFFHTYPLDQDEYLDYIVGSTTFAEHFFATAAEHLRPRGVFTYMTHEIDSLSRGHQRALFRQFEAIEIRVLRDLEIPSDVQDSWWADEMVIVRAVK